VTALTAAAVSEIVFSGWRLPRLGPWGLRERTFGLVECRFVQPGQRLCEGGDPRVGVFGGHVWATRQSGHDDSGAFEHRPTPDQPRSA
jgi:hypothetical protein